MPLVLLTGLITTLAMLAAWNVKKKPRLFYFLMLSMLRQVFYGENNSGLVIEEYLGDAKPREVFISLCLLLPIIGVGMYPNTVFRYCRYI